MKNLLVGLAVVAVLLLPSCTAELSMGTITLRASVEEWAQSNVLKNIDKLADAAAAKIAAKAEAAKEEADEEVVEEVQE